jgi:DNA polymerase-3 subunit chi
MTQIDFYTHVENKFGVACQIIGKAYERALRVIVYTGDAEATGQMDRLLWTYSAIGFVPHCRAQHTLAQETPVLVDHDYLEVPRADVLVNLRQDSPSFFGRFPRLVEIVSLDGADRESARARFRYYRDRGYEIRSHDLRARA